MTLAEDAEEELRVDLGDREVGEFVEDQEVDALVAGDDPSHLAGISCLGQLGDEPAGGGEADQVALACSLDAEGGGEVGLAGAGVSE